MQAFVDIPICEKLFKRLLPLANHSVVGSLWADDNMIKGPSIWLHRELASVADMLASLVASRVTNNASVTNLAFVMLTEFVWRAELAIPAFTIVLANASTTTFFTPAASRP